MRAAAFELKQRRIVNCRLVDLACMLRNELADHLEVAEFFQRNVLQHVANAGIFDVEGLDPVLQRRGELTGGTAKLLE
jgi:hypothetical protein